MPMTALTRWWFLGVSYHQMTSPLACFVFLTIIRFKFLFNLYKSSFRQTNAKFLSVSQYRQIHWQLLNQLSDSSTDMNRQTDNWQILSVCQYRQIHSQILASLKLNLSSGFKAVDCSRTNKNAEWRSGESTRLLLMWSGFESGVDAIYVCCSEFVVGSRPCSERFFSVYFGFPSPQK